jgi:ATP adenylyltransferase
MATEQLWAPWRLQYVTGDSPPGCPLCAQPARADDRAALVVHRGEHVCAILNLYPYNPGHLMVIPYRHVACLTQLNDAELDEGIRLVQRAISVLRTVMGSGPDGFNVGLNLGSAAGAGIPDHLHWQVVPRWMGDTNFMPVLADTKVIPQHLDTTWQLVSDGFATWKEQPDA